jgi:hypothetical protein
VSRFCQIEYTSGVMEDGMPCGKPAVAAPRLLGYETNSSHPGLEFAPKRSCPLWLREARAKCVAPATRGSTARCPSRFSGFFASDPERLRRFDQEAHAVAALTTKSSEHPGPPDIGSPQLKPHARWKRVYNNNNRLLPSGETDFSGAMPVCCK